MKLEVRGETRPYEAVIIMHPDASEEEQKALFRRNQAIVKEFSGTVGHLDTWGKRSLANPVAGHKRAYFFHTAFETAPKAIAELERTMRNNDRVLRFQHTRLADGTKLSEFNENFKKSLAESAQREREREAKFQARKAAQRGSPRGPRGPREDFGGDMDDGGEA
jgi:small subunit ribosomal protein S6